MNLFHAVQYLALVWAMEKKTLVVSLMHFWYDGFVWSVQKREI